MNQIVNHFDVAVSTQLLHPVAGSGNSSDVLSREATPLLQKSRMWVGAASSSQWTRLHQQLLHDIVKYMNSSAPEFSLPVFPPQPAIGERELLSSAQATALMRLFKIFANDTRLRLLHALVRDGEMCVGDLADAVGMKPQAVSNQLQRLVDRNILGSRRNGNSVLYRIVDPCVPVLLERGLCLIECCPENE